ncbi:MAG: hypothetical protein QE487_18565 [Fluviicola sp.]|nr:hypothetical protein [Fluviicola sp.]
MKKLVLATALLIAGFVNAQGPSYDDLRILYADGNYDKLVKSSESYTQKDKSKTDALPYMWLARGLYKISQSGAADEKYKNAYKEAIAAVGKCMKMDKGGDVQREYSEFFEEFKMSLVEVISNDLSVPDYKKASSWVLKYYKLDPTSLGGKLLEGACKFRNADKGGANACWKETDKKIAALASIEDWSPADKQLFKMGIIQTADCYVTSRQVDKAKTLLGKVAQYFEEDEEFKAKYDEIVN